jgi:hypothetical protein
MLSFIARFGHEPTSVLVTTKHEISLRKFATVDSSLSIPVIRAVFLVYFNTLRQSMITIFSSKRICYAISTLSSVV